MYIQAFHIGSTVVGVLTNSDMFGLLNKIHSIFSCCANDAVTSQCHHNVLVAGTNPAR